MLNSLLNAIFGCSHRRTTFPLTPARKSTGYAQAPGAPRHGTYVVCLDCGKEFDYDWEDMHIGKPVTPLVSAQPAQTLSAANR